MDTTQVLRGLQESLPRVFHDLPLEDLFVVLAERSALLSTIAQGLRLPPHASVKEIEAAFDMKIEPACRSTAELDVEVPQEYIAMVEQIHRLEMENCELRVQTERMQQGAVLREACSSIVRHPRTRSA